MSVHKVFRLLVFVHSRNRVDGFFFSSRRRHTKFDCDWSSDCALPILPQQTVADGMKGTRPAQALGDAVADAAQGFVERLARDFLRAAAHLGGRAARESQHHDKIGRAHVLTPVTVKSRMPSSA